MRPPETYATAESPLTPPTVVGIPKSAATPVVALKASRTVITHNVVSFWRTDDAPLLLPVHNMEDAFVGVPTIVISNAPSLKRVPSLSLPVTANRASAVEAACKVKVIVVPGSINVMASKSVPPSISGAPKSPSTPLVSPSASRT